MSLKDILLQLLNLGVDCRLHRRERRRDVIVARGKAASDERIRDYVLPRVQPELKADRVDYDVNHRRRLIVSRRLGLERDLLVFGEDVLLRVKRERLEDYSYIIEPIERQRLLEHCHRRAK